ncbi:MAG: hypothetical protein WBN09_03550, partial [Woeseiaceae bacterium]
IRVSVVRFRPWPPDTKTPREGAFSYLKQDEIATDVASFFLSGTPQRFCWSFAQVATLHGHKSSGLPTCRIFMLGLIDSDRLLPILTLRAAAPS